MDLKGLTRDVFLFAATLRERLDNDRKMTAKTLMDEARNHFGAMDREAGKHPALEVRYQQVRFALVALVDDLVVVSTWQFAPDWPLLENSYYGTNIAGDRVYDLLAAFSAADTDLIELFFFVLALGFRGKYGLDEQQWAATLEGLYRRLPNPPELGEFQISPEAYHVIKCKSQRLDPLFSLWRSVMIFSVCLMILFVFYKVAWRDVVVKARTKSLEVKEKLADESLRQKLDEVAP